MTVPRAASREPTPASHPDCSRRDDAGRGGRVGRGDGVLFTSFPHGVDIDGGGVVKPTVLARDGTRLSVSLENAWNTTDRVPLEAIPEFLTRSFVESEDQHFFQHHGVDWNARWAAAWEDLRHGAAVRGASTITEQVVRMLHPRPADRMVAVAGGF